MSLLVRFAPESVTPEQYDATVRDLEQQGDWPPDGMDLHVCFKTNGGIHVSEIWDSQQQFEAFGERLMPLLAEHGIEPGEPTVLEVHNIVRR